MSDQTVTSHLCDQWKKATSVAEQETTLMETRVYDLKIVAMGLNISKGFCNVTV